MRLVAPRKSSVATRLERCDLVLGRTRAFRVGSPERSAGRSTSLMRVTTRSSQRASGHHARASPSLRGGRNQGPRSAAEARTLGRHRESTRTGGWVSTFPSNSTLSSNRVDRSVKAAAQPTPWRPVSFLERPYPWGSAALEARAPALRHVPARGKPHPLRYERTFMIGRPRTRPKVGSLLGRPARRRGSASPAATRTTRIRVPNPSPPSDGSAPPRSPWKICKKRGGVERRGGSTLLRLAAVLWCGATLRSKRWRL